LKIDDVKEAGKEIKKRKNDKSKRKYQICNSNSDDHLFFSNEHSVDPFFFDEHLLS
jgi:hypothetical protein